MMEHEFMEKFKKEFRELMVLVFGAGFVSAIVIVEAIFDNF